MRRRVERLTECAGVNERDEMLLVVEEYLVATKVNIAELDRKDAGEPYRSSMTSKGGKGSDKPSPRSSFDGSERLPWLVEVSKKRGSSGTDRGSEELSKLSNWAAMTASGSTRKSGNPNSASPPCALWSISDGTLLPTSFSLSSNWAVNV